MGGPARGRYLWNMTVRIVGWHPSGVESQRLATAGISHTTIPFSHHISDEGRTKISVRLMT